MAVDQSWATNIHTWKFLQQTATEEFKFDKDLIFVREKLAFQKNVRVPRDIGRDSKSNKSRESLY